MFHERRFRWLLRLLPRSFRDDHERDLMQAWRDEARDAHSEGRRGVWTGALKDTLRVAPREFADAWRVNGRGAVKGLLRSPGFSAAVVLTLALATGATTGVFTLVNGVLLGPLPWSEPDRVGVIWPVQPSGARTWLSVPELEDLARELPSVAGVSGLMDLRLNLVGDGTAQEVQSLAVSHGFLRMLGVAPALGRDFLPEDDREGAAPVAILSHDFWRARFGGDASMVGRSIRLDDRAYEVVGVLPRGFAILPASSVMPEKAEVWLALEPHLASRDRTVRFLHVFGRLKPGVTFAGVAAELDAFGRRTMERFASAYPGGEWRFTIAPFGADVLGTARVALSLIFGLVLLVLVMACANVANLLLARGNARRTELAVRAALGAGPARLAGELTAEALVLAAAGSTVGLGLALAVPPVLRALDPGALPRLDEVRIDLRVLLFTGALVFLTAALFTFAPLVERLRLRGLGTAMTARGGGRTRRSARVGSALIVVQTALATTVIVTTCFLMAGFVRLHGTELGFSTSGLVTARVTLSPRYATGPDVVRFFEAATAAIREHAGIVDAAAVTELPLSGAMLGSAFFTGPPAVARPIDADLRGVTPNYFAVVGTPLASGRCFTDLDTAASVPVAIVDEGFARRLGPDGRVVGRRIRWMRQPDVEVEIVGVVRSMRHRGPAEPPRDTVYRPYRQYVRGSMFLVARTTMAEAAAAPALRAAVASVDPSQPAADVATMAERRDRSLTRARTSLLLAASLAVLALGLGLVGLSGVLSVAVGQRLREFGVRIALGATPAGIRALVLAEGLGLTLPGIAAGALAAGGAAAQIRGALDGTGATDPLLYVLGSTVVLLASLAAFWMPARRAGAADPADALKAE